MNCCTKWCVYLGIVIINMCHNKFGYMWSALECSTFYCSRPIMHACGCRLCEVIAVAEKVDTWLAHTDTQTDTLTTAHLQVSWDPLNSWLKLPPNLHYCGRKVMFEEFINVHVYQAQQEFCKRYETAKTAILSYTVPTSRAHAFLIYILWACGRMAQMSKNKMATSINVHVSASDFIAREQMLASKSTLHYIATDSVNNPQHTVMFCELKISFENCCIGY